MRKIDWIMFSFLVPLGAGLLYLIILTATLLVALKAVGVSVGG